MDSTSPPEGQKQVKVPNSGESSTIKDTESPTKQGKKGESKRKKRAGNDRASRLTRKEIEQGTSVSEVANQSPNEKNSNLVHDDAFPLEFFSKANTLLNTNMPIS